MLEIDYERLRADLVDYFGSAIFSVSPLAIMDVTTVENATPEELIRIALKNNFDLSEYQLNVKKF